MLILNLCFQQSWKQSHNRCSKESTGGAGNDHDKQLRPAGSVDNKRQNRGCCETTPQLNSYKPFEPTGVKMHPCIDFVLRVQYSGVQST